MVCYFMSKKGAGGIAGALVWAQISLDRYANDQEWQLPWGRNWMTWGSGVGGRFTFYQIPFCTVGMCYLFQIALK